MEIKQENQAFEKSHMGLWPGWQRRRRTVKGKQLLLSQWCQVKQGLRGWRRGPYSTALGLHHIRMKFSTSSAANTCSFPSSNIDAWSRTSPRQKWTFGAVPWPSTLTQYQTHACTLTLYLTQYWTNAGTLTQYQTHTSTLTQYQMNYWTSAGTLTQYQIRAGTLTLYLTQYWTSAGTLNQYQTRTSTINRYLMQTVMVP